MCNTVKINVKSINKNTSTVEKKTTNKTKTKIDGVGNLRSMDQSNRKLLRLRIVYHKTTSRWAVQSQIDGSERDRKLLRLCEQKKKTSRWAV